MHYGSSNTIVCSYISFSRTNTTAHGYRQLSLCPFLRLPLTISLLSSNPLKSLSRTSRKPDVRTSCTPYAPVVFCLALNTSNKPTAVPLCPRHLALLHVLEDKFSILCHTVLRAGKRGWQSALGLREEGMLFRWTGTGIGGGTGGLGWRAWWEG